MNELTQARLRELLSYDRDTGEFTRRIQAGRELAGSIAGARHHSGYLFISVDGKRYAAHRLAWFYVTGAWPPLIDHRNCVKQDNRFPNLREADHSLNAQNRVHARADNQSGLLGASRIKNRWQASIRVRGVKHHLGSFATAEEAHDAYMEAKGRFHPEARSGM